MTASDDPVGGEKSSFLLRTGVRVYLSTGVTDMRRGMSVDMGSFCHRRREEMKPRSGACDFFRSLLAFQS